jgi:hypothetical protein
MNLEMCFVTSQKLVNFMSIWIIFSFSTRLLLYWVSQSII